MTYRCDVPHGIMFHHFHGDRHHHSPGSISSEELASLLRLIGPERILEPEEWLERASRERLEPQDLCLTFDDALLCQFEIALPVLQQFDLRAFWFVYSNVFEGEISRFEVYRVFRTTCFQEVDEFYELFFARIRESKFSDRAQRACDPSEIARRREMFPFYSAADVRFRILRDLVLNPSDYDSIMQDLIEERGRSLEDLAEHLWMTGEHLRILSDSGHIVGLHSYSHPMRLGEQTREQQHAEYARNYAQLSSITGAPRAIAYPAGSYNAETLSLLRSMGIQCGFRSSMAPPYQAGRLNPNPLELAREDHANLVRTMQYS
ncbi:MAG: polysaccharide deacetylase family protein [Pirellulales bacterium]